MNDQEEMLSRLRRLKELGVRISIDDFGTGYSSLNYLRHFPFDKLKIDQSFIRNVTRDPDDAAITLTIINMARTLKLRVIAEGGKLKDSFGISSFMVAMKSKVIISADRWKPRRLPG